MEGFVWIAESTSRVRCGVQHLRSRSGSEKRICDIEDTEAMSFQDLVRRLPHSTFIDLTTHTHAPDDAWRGVWTRSLVGTHEAHEIEEMLVRSNHDNLLQHHVQDLIGFHQIDL